MLQVGLNPRLLNHDTVLPTIVPLPRPSRLDTLLFFSSQISDTPCNEMHTDQFIEEIKTIGTALGLKPPLVIQVTLKTIRSLDALKAN